MPKWEASAMISGLLLCCMAAMLPLIMLYFPNIAEISFRNMLPYFGVLFGIGLLAWAGMRLITRRKYLAASAAVWLLVILNVGRIVPSLQTVFPLVGVKVIAPVTLIILIAATWGLSRLSENFLRDAVKVAALAMAAFILATAVPAVLSLPRSEKREPLKNVEIDITSAKETDRPNIYWIIPDEYAGSNQLRKYFHYDNSPFLNQLTNLGFTVSEDSYNWSGDTFTILRDILCLRYMQGETTEREEIVADPDAPLWKYLKRLGYEIYEIESAPKFGLKQRIKGFEEDDVPMTAAGETVANLLLRYSLLYRYENEICDRLLPKQSKSTVREQILKVLEWTEDPDWQKAKKPACTVIYTRSPHLPIFFDRDGGEVPKKHRYEKKEREYYLDQLIYISGKLRDMCSRIIETDPDAIIILQSDHGWRTIDNITWLDLSNIVNAVYFRGEPIEEIKGKNGLNTWIAVLRKQFKLDVPDVEEKRMKNEYRTEFRNPEAEDPNKDMGIQSDKP